MSTTDAHVDGAEAAVNYLELTFALMGGALVWLLRLVANASLVEQSCMLGATWPLWLSSGIATLIAAAALVTSRKYHRFPDEAASARWLGLLGIMFNILAIAGIVLETAPVAVLDVCRQVGSA